MYWKVPRMRALGGQGLLAGGRARSSEAAGAGASGGPALGQAEVEELHPAFVSMTLPGFRSRWTMPCAVGHVEGVGDLDAVAQDLVEGERALLEPVRERLALEVLHDQEVDAVVLADVVERADVRMGEGSRWPWPRARTAGAVRARPRGVREGP